MTTATATNPQTVSLLGASNKTIESALGLADNFDNFLSMLTTQLQHQDPLSPMDASQFTTQLVQFSMVEQQVGQNARLDELIKVQGGSQAVGATSFLGTQVEAFGDTTSLKNGSAQWTYTLPADAQTLTVTIKNAAGDVVRTLNGDKSTGKHTVTWDGKNDQGIAQPEGKYTINVGATSATGDPLTVATGLIGTVSGVTVENGKLVLDLGGFNVELDKVLSVTKPS